MSPRTWLTLLGVVWLSMVRADTQNVAQSPSAATPGAQAAHVLVFDQRLQQIVLLKGAGQTADAAEMWTWDGRRWTLLDRPGPPRRTLAGAAYDSRRNQLVVFGGRIGNDGITMGDTWTWDGNAWRDATQSAIGIRNHHAMAFDEHRGRIVMYGGTIPPPAISASEQLKQRDKWRWPIDTWEWDGHFWHRAFEQGPGARSGPALVYDAARRNTVLFGGVGADGSYATGTWIWDGTTWRQAASDGPPPRASHQMIFESDAGVVLLYGGGNRSGRLQDMWRWDGERWTEITLKDPTPGPRNGHAMAYDRARRRLVLHGGYSEASSPHGDTWEWDGTSWSPRD